MGSTRREERIVFQQFVVPDEDEFIQELGIELVPENYCTETANHAVS
ncbi:hypothetical protein [Nocardia sp. NPDC004123]